MGNMADYLALRVWVENLGIYTQCISINIFDPNGAGLGQDDVTVRLLIKSNTSYS